MEQPPPAEQQPIGSQSIHTPPAYSRIPSLDIIRGIGVLGALFVSIWIFGGFSEQQQNQLLLTSKGWNYRVFGALQIFFSGKMLALVAIVFGAAMVIFLSKQQQAGQQPAVDVFVKKYLWLIVFGVFNGLVLLWSRDILFHLGIMAILLFVFFRMKPRALLVATLLMTVVYCGKYYWDYADHKKMYGKYTAAVTLEKKYEKDSVAKAKKAIVAKKDTLTKFQKQDKEAWEGLVAGKKVDLKKDDDNIKKMRSGNYGKVWNHLLPATQSRQAEWLYKKGVWYLAAMIFMGMWLYKIGFFTSRFTRGQYFLLAIAGITVGVLLAWYRVHFQQISLQDYEKFVKNKALPHTIFFPIEKAAMALGYASLVMALLHTTVFSKIFSAFAAVGKMALTNYLLQSIVCTMFFFGYGMGYFARLTQFQLYLFVAEVLLLQTIFSVLWLRRFTYGPAEWLWRRISYGKMLPHTMRKQSTTPQTVTVLS